MPIWDSTASAGTPFTVTESQAYTADVSVNRSQKWPAAQLTRSVASVYMAGTSACGKSRTDGAGAVVFPPRGPQAKRRRTVMRLPYFRMRQN